MDKILKGHCGICNSKVYADDERYKRRESEPYICGECWVQLEETKCPDCTDLFNCTEEHNDHFCHT